MATIDLGREFVDGIMARRPEALEGLLRVHGPEIHAVAFLIVRNELDAEEIAADTLMTAWRKIGTLRDPDRLRPWLLRIATRLALRRRRLTPRVVSLDTAGELAASASTSSDWPAVVEALNRLPPRTRAAVALHYVADLPTREVAEILGRSENTIKTQLREGLRQLRSSLLDDPRSAVAVGKEKAV
jgi:RNA polymerase sigma-70 factor (ECF subfamily)